MAGFQVKADYLQQLDEKTIQKYALPKDDRLFVAYKN
jgi:hypothetical protein